MGKREWMLKYKAMAKKNTPVGNKLRRLRAGNWTWDDLHVLLAGKVYCWLVDEFLSPRIELMDQECSTCNYCQKEMIYES